jgi:hypothetical protein
MAVQPRRGAKKAYTWGGENNRPDAVPGKGASQAIGFDGEQDAGLDPEPCEVIV